MGGVRTGINDEGQTADPDDHHAGKVPEIETDLCATLEYFRADNLPT